MSKPKQNVERTLRIQGLEHPNAHEALVELNFSGDHAISIGGRYFTVSHAELDRIERAGVQPTMWHHHEPTARLVSVPGRHG
jgi:hypothetical protein